MLHNPTRIQHDGYNCGIFSPISLYMLLMYDGNISKAVQEGIGDNGVNIHGTKPNVNTDINKVRDNIVGAGGGAGG